MQNQYCKVNKQCPCLGFFGNFHPHIKSIIWLIHFPVFTYGSFYSSKLTGNWTKKVILVHAINIFAFSSYFGRTNAEKQVLIFVLSSPNYQYYSINQGLRFQLTFSLRAFSLSFLLSSASLLILIRSLLSSSTVLFSSWSNLCMSS